MRFTKFVLLYNFFKLREKLPKDRQEWVKFTIHTFLPKSIFVILLQLEK